jgi:hypothetical protein
MNIRDVDIDEPRERRGDRPPLHWSTLTYVFGQAKEDRYAEEETTPKEIVAKLRQVDFVVSQDLPGHLQTSIGRHPTTSGRANGEPARVCLYSW